jgi:hypothetical protein
MTRLTCLIAGLGHTAFRLSFLESDLWHDISLSCMAGGIQNEVATVDRTHLEIVSSVTFRHLEKGDTPCGRSLSQNVEDCTAIVEFERTCAWKEGVGVPSLKGQWPVHAR